MAANPNSVAQSGPACGGSWANGYATANATADDVSAKRLEVYMTMQQQYAEQLKLSKALSARLDVMASQAVLLQDVLVVALQKLGSSKGGHKRKAEATASDDLRACHGPVNTACQASNRQTTTTTTTQAPVAAAAAARRPSPHAAQAPPQSLSSPIGFGAQCAGPTESSFMWPLRTETPLLPPFDAATSIAVAAATAGSPSSCAPYGITTLSDVCRQPHPPLSSATLDRPVSPTQAPSLPAAPPSDCSVNWSAPADSTTVSAPTANGSNDNCSVLRLELLPSAPAPPSCYLPMVPQDFATAMDAAMARATGKSTAHAAEACFESPYLEAGAAAAAAAGARAVAAPAAAASGSPSPAAALAMQPAGRWELPATLQNLEAAAGGAQGNARVQPNGARTSHHHQQQPQQQWHKPPKVSRSNNRGSNGAGGGKSSVTKRRQPPSPTSNMRHATAQLSAAADGSGGFLVRPTAVRAAPTAMHNPLVFSPSYFSNPHVVQVLQMQLQGQQQGEATETSLSIQRLLRPPGCGSAPSQVRKPGTALTGAAPLPLLPPPQLTPTAIAAAPPRNAGLAVSEPWFGLQMPATRSSLPVSSVGGGAAAAADVGGGGGMSAWWLQGRLDRAALPAAPPPSQAAFLPSGLNPIPDPFLTCNAAATAGAGMLQGGSMPGGAAAVAAMSGNPFGGMALSGALSGL
ncbi:hypothetical protein PLESTM_001189900 [Pleodorina starrii]|nr:hypothetical protein PLESTM_001189900 [Pleodorina starrii]